MRGPLMTANNPGSPQAATSIKQHQPHSRSLGGAVGVLLGCGLSVQVCAEDGDGCADQRLLRHHLRYTQHGTSGVCQTFAHSRLSCSECVVVNLDVSDPEQAG